MCERPFYRSVGVVERGEIDPMPCCDGLDFVNPLGSDEASSLRKRLEAALQSKSHPFEQTAVSHVGEWMPIEDSAKIGRETQSPRDLSEASEEYAGSRHVRAGGQVLRVPCIANNGLGCDAA